MLAAIDMAMSRYLEERGSPPDAPLVADVPVALQDHGGAGNRITILQVPMGLPGSKPAERLRRIVHETRQMKQEVRVLSGDSLMLYSILGHSLASTIESLHLGELPMLANVVISNPAGFTERVQFNGADVELALPISVVAHHQVLNVTVTTYVGRPARHLHRAEGSRARPRTNGRLHGRGARPARGGRCARPEEEGQGALTAAHRRAGGRPPAGRPPGAAGACFNPAGSGANIRNPAAGPATNNTTLGRQSAGDTAMHGQMMDSPLLITEIMRFADRNFPDGQVVSITFDNPRHRTTYREVFRRARKLANALRAAGIKPGDRIATLAWNDYRHLELYYAVSCMGAVLHTINPRLFPEQLEYIVNHAEDRLLFIDPTLLPVLAPLQGKIPTVERVIVMTSAAAMPDAVAGKLPDYESFIADQPDEFEWPALEESAASALCYTSGTTGNPKGVLYSHRSTVLHAYAGCMADSMGMSGRDAVLAVVPMFHANAWGLPYNAPDHRREAGIPGPEDGRPGDADRADERGRRDARGRRADGVDPAAQPPAAVGRETRRRSTAPWSVERRCRCP